MADRLTRFRGRAQPVYGRPLRIRLTLFCCLIALFYWPAHARSENSEKKPVQLKSDSLQYFKAQDIYLAVGAVSIRQGTLVVQADSARIKGETGEVDAFGNVHFSDGENEFEAQRLIFNIDTQLGVLYDGKIFMKSENYYIQGKEIVRSALDRYELKTGAFTACDCDDHPAWRLRAGDLDLTLDEYLFARNVVFYVKDVPIFYLPYFIFPVKRERQTGLLVPRVGYSSRYGFRYQQDFFWAISRHQDATISLEHRGEKGEGLGLEYRYALARNTFGQLNTVFFKDQESNLDRWEVRYTHEQRLSDRVRAKLDLSYVNENDTFQDLSDRTADRARQNVESNLFVTYQGQASFAYLLARYTQDLTTISNNQTPQRLPELGYHLVEYRLGDGPVHLNLESTATHFWSEGGLDLQRIDLYPKLTMPLPLTPRVTLTPWAGFRETWYSEGAQNPSSIAREIVPAGLTLEGRALIQFAESRYVINPTLFYENIAVETHTDIPQIDAVDALHDRQSLTFSLMQRYIAPDAMGVPQEKMHLQFTETLHLDKIPAAALDARRFSDLRGELSFRLGEKITVRVETFFDVYDHHLNGWNSDLHFTATPYLDLTITQRESRDGTLPQKGDLFNAYYLGDRETISPEIDFLSETLTLSTPWGVRFVNRSYYDVDQSKLVEVDYILEYQAQCWALGLSYLDFHDRNEFSFLITLKGLSTFSPEQ